MVDVVEPRSLRECRTALGQSQAAFAAMLGVSPESYRTWDAGRRAVPPQVMARARAIATHRDEHALLPLPVLALLIGVHVKTLRAAARDGRLPVTYDTRTTFRRLRAYATLAAATQFRRSYFGRQVRRADRPQPLTWASVPEDYNVQIRALRRARGLSQGQLATLWARRTKPLSISGRRGNARRRPCSGNESPRSPVSKARATSWRQSHTARARARPASAPPRPLRRRRVGYDNTDHASWMVGNRSDARRTRLQPFLR